MHIRYFIGYVYHVCLQDTIQSTLSLCLFCQATLLPMPLRSLLLTPRSGFNDAQGTAQAQQKQLSKQQRTATSNETTNTKDQRTEGPDTLRPARHSTAAHTTHNRPHHRPRHNTTKRGQHPKAASNNKGHSTTTRHKNQTTQSNTPRQKTTARKTTQRAPMKHRIETPTAWCGAGHERHAHRQNTTQQHTHTKQRASRDTTGHSTP